MTTRRQFVWSFFFSHKLFRFCIAYPDIPSDLSGIWRWWNEHYNYDNIARWSRLAHSVTLPLIYDKNLLSLTPSHLLDSRMTHFKSIKRYIDLKTDVVSQTLPLYIYTLKTAVKVSLFFLPSLTCKTKYNCKRKKIILNKHFNKCIHKQSYYILAQQIICQNNRKKYKVETKIRTSLFYSLYFSLYFSNKWFNYRTNRSWSMIYLLKYTQFSSENKCMISLCCKAERENFQKWETFH